MRTLLVVTFAVIVGCGTSEGDSRSRTSTLLDLSDSLATLRTEFNAHRGENRFIALLAPT